MSENIDEQVERLRADFLEDKLDFADSRDVERAKKDDFWLGRFLRHHRGNYELALQMLRNVVKWRKEFRTNDIRDLVKNELLIEGGLFPHGYDKDGCPLFIFKCVKHTKGTKDMEDLKRCVVYWFERLEKENPGKQISIVFDMAGCGLSNMDLEFTKYLIGLFKDHYPYFLNYIIIFEMPWILNAAFKLIKTWLPEGAIEKIKFVNKKDLNQFIPTEQALTCWGGSDDYTFTFIPEATEDVSHNNNLPTRKVTCSVTDLLEFWFKTPNH